MASVNNDPTSEKPKILLVDDREDNLLSMEVILDPDGYQFSRAYSGEQALKILLNEFDFALILMDVKMPVLNGFETATLIHERERLRHIPIIFITANNYGDENIFKGYKAGGIDYIFKPINPEVLRAKVAVFIDIYKKNALLFEHEQKLSAANQNLSKEISALRTAEEKTRILNAKLQCEFSELASILLTSKASNDCFKFEHCDLNGLLKSFLADMEDHLREKMATVVIEPLPVLNVSRLLMRPLFENLIRNAISFSTENVKPIIKIRSENHVALKSQSNKYCRIIVEDNGAGIEKKTDHTSHLLGQSQNNGKSVLTDNALSLCKKIMDRHNGSLVARTKTDNGAATIVSFPITN